MGIITKEFAIQRIDKLLIQLDEILDPKTVNYSADHNALTMAKEALKEKRNKGTWIINIVKEKVSNNVEIKCYHYECPFCKTWQDREKQKFCGECGAELNYKPENDLEEYCARTRCEECQRTQECKENERQEAKSCFALEKMGQL